jgi:hypothetical protein
MKLFLIKSLRKLILNFFTVMLFFGILFSLTLTQPNSATAADGCERLGQCINDRKCSCPDGEFQQACAQDPSLLLLSNDPCGSAIIGGVTPPGAIKDINSAAGGNIGLIFFISRIIKFANIVAGILVMLNFVFAGLSYITGAGNAASMAQINEKLTWSFIGIIIIVSSYTLAAIFGLVFYADPTFIISPQFTGALQQ